MPSVMDVPELVEDVATHDRTIETLGQPPIHRDRPRFWRTLMHKIAGYCTTTPRKRHASPSYVHRPFETPADMLARQYPTLYIRAFCGV